MREKGIQRDKAMDSVRLQRLIDACDTKENTALYLLEDWNYEPQVRVLFLPVSNLASHSLDLLHSERHGIKTSAKGLHFKFKKRTFKILKKIMCCNSPFWQNFWVLSFILKFIINM